jgi:hypothetical protein
MNFFPVACVRRRLYRFFRNCNGEFVLKWITVIIIRSGKKVSPARREGALENFLIEEWYNS